MKTLDPVSTAEAKATILEARLAGQKCNKVQKWIQNSTHSTVVSHVGGRPFWMKNFKCIFLVSLASLGAERSGKIDFRTPEAQKTEKMLSQMGSYVHFTV